MHQNITLRNVELLDESILLEWANDYEVRRWSWVNNKKISKAEHHSWFSDQLREDSNIIYMFEIDGVPFGYVRFQISVSEIALHYLVAKEYRGYGFGKTIVQMAASNLRENIGNREIYAYTFPENCASRKSLDRAGFIALSDEMHCRYVLPKCNQVGNI